MDLDAYDGGLVGGTGSGVQLYGCLPVLLGASETGVVSFERSGKALRETFRLVPRGWGEGEAEHVARIAVSDA